MDISFDCNSCGKHLIADQAGAGITIDCPACGKPVYVPSPSSQKPSDQPTRIEVKSATPKAPPVSPPKVSASGGNRTVWTLPPLAIKYGALRAIASFCQFAAVPVAIISVVVAFVLFRFEASLLPTPLAFIQPFLTVVGGVISMVTLWGAAESIRVFIDIEENTRATRQMMEYELRAKYQPSTPSTRVTPTRTSTTDQSAQSASQVHFSSR
jgi:predicted RNA-binding Zn-ribbon protein involved in translation (DUF1610 family)